MATQSHTNPITDNAIIETKRTVGDRTISNPLACATPMPKAVNAPVSKIPNVTTFHHWCDRRSHITNPRPS